VLLCQCIGLKEDDTPSIVLQRRCIKGNNNNDIRSFRTETGLTHRITLQYRPTPNSMYSIILFM